MKIFPVYYFPPVSWFAAALQEKTILLEEWEFYKKQNYFNRMRIKTPEKTLKLSIPVQKAQEYSPLRDRLITYDGRWQKDHWMSVQSAYRSSPYFEYYEDRIQPLFETETTHLLHHNLDILETLCDCLQIDLEWEMTTAYQGSDAYDGDYRGDFDPRGARFPDWFRPVDYPQVFGDTFTPDLSILDLMCNQGPESVRILRESFVK